jgi:hypothetical protein
VFHYTSWHFYAFFETNLLMRCHSASFLFSAVFVFQKSYTGNILGNWTKQKPNIQKFTEASRSLKRRWRGATGRSHHRAAWPTPGPRPLVVRPPWPTSGAAPSPIKTPDGKNQKIRSLFQNTSRSTAAVDLRSGGSRSSSRHPVGEGNRHRRSSSSPCLPPAQ